ncbi:Transcription factor TGA2.3 [Vitis vinifera]|uniref:Transcription factor TGA2.3 n=1 Tax=Vitis vinifera TaxID=29760 RepID=A0A438GHJ8_VITVI|nr:Transcription factor TGA2.3 [Vitis vinifera]
MGGNEALAFDMGYARWLDEYQRLINDLRSVVNSHVGDNELRILVDSNMATCNAWSYDEHLIRVVICCGLYPGICSVCKMESHSH